MAIQREPSCVDSDATAQARRQFIIASKKMQKTFVSLTNQEKDDLIARAIESAKSQPELD